MENNPSPPKSKSPPIVPYPKGTQVQTTATFINPPPGVSSTRRKNVQGVVQRLKPNSDYSLYEVAYSDGKQDIFGYWEIDPVVYHSVESKLDEDYYDLPRALKGVKRKKEEARLRNEFLSDLKVSLGLGSHPKGDLLIATAWKLTREEFPESELDNLHEALAVAKELLPLIQ